MAIMLRSLSKRRKGGEYLEYLSMEGAGAGPTREFRNPGAKEKDEAPSERNEQKIFEV